MDLGQAEGFDRLHEIWVQYLMAAARVLPEDDVRLNLGAEVRTRLRQLALILRLKKKKRKKKSFW